MNIYKELKSKYKFHFDLPDFVKDFLHEISLKRTFKNKMDERLESVNEEDLEDIIILG